MPAPVIPPLLMRIAQVGAYYAFKEIVAMINNKAVYSSADARTSQDYLFPIFERYWYETQHKGSSLVQKAMEYEYEREDLYKPRRYVKSNLDLITGGQGAALPIYEDLLAFLEQYLDISRTEAITLWEGLDNVEGYGSVSPFKGIQKQDLPDHWDKHRYTCYDYVTAKWVATDRITPLQNIGGVYRYACFDRLAGKWYQADEIFLPKEQASLLRSILGY